MTITNSKESTFSEWTPVEKTILERRSIRKFKNKQVPEYLIQRILEAGRFAPSQGNCQPWKFLVIRDKKILDEMEADCIKNAKIFKSIFDWKEKKLFKKLALFHTKLWIKLFPNKFHPIPFTATSLIADGQLSIFHGAPTVIIILMDTRGIGKPILDIGICGQNMVLSAHGFGLGTCWVGFIELIRFSKKWKKRFNIQYPYKIVESLSIGYPFGNPDGMVERESHAIDWFEDGQLKTKY